MRMIAINLVVAASLLATACSGFIAVEKRRPARPVVVHEQRSVHPAHLGIPPGHLPPPGHCRIWIPGRPPGHQPPPGRCSNLEHHVPRGAWLLYRPSHDHKHVEVSVFDAERPRLVVSVRLYEASSGRYIEGHALTHPPEVYLTNPTNTSQRRIGESRHTRDLEIEGFAGGEGGKLELELDGWDGRILEIKDKRKHREHDDDGD